jgi:hypothetical protein
MNSKPTHHICSGTETLGAAPFKGARRDGRTRLPQGLQTLRGLAPWCVGRQGQPVGVRLNQQMFDSQI